MPALSEKDRVAAVRLTKLVNLGPVSAGWLIDAGIRTPAALRKMGAIKAFHRVVMHRGGIGVSLNLLYALEGALRGVRWDYLPREERVELRRAAENPARSR